MFITFVPDYRIDPPPQKDYPSCPVCGSDCYDYVYKGWDNNVCGCSDCITALEADDYANEVEENERNRT